ncbi:MAG: DUF58 domain-containing protein [Proteobacteria bacterium]|nr:DUF58 domain-containing protein [Pseudomonadota bacterium]
MGLRQNAFLLLVAMGLIGIVGDWAGPEPLARLWRLPLALLCAGLAYEAFSVRALHLSLRLAGAPRWRLGRATPVRYEFLRRGVRRIVVELAPEPPRVAELDRSVRTVELGPDSAALALSVTACRLGGADWPPQRVRVAGPLGLAWWPRRLEPEARAEVVPDVLGAVRDSAANEVGGDRVQVRSGAGSELLQLRPFRPGDPVRAVDWKATARRGQLVSRDFTEDQHLDVVVAIDAGRGSGVWVDGLDRLGHYVNATARFAEYVVQQDDRVGVVVYGDRPLASLPPARGAAATARLRRLLAGVEVQPTDSNAIHAAMQVRTLVRHHCLVILLTDIDDAGSTGQLGAAARLLRREHRTLVVGLRSAALESFGEVPVGDWLDPFRALAAGESHENRRRSIAALAAAGVRALTVRPASLERAVFAAYADLKRRRLA